MIMPWGGKVKKCQVGGRGRHKGDEAIRQQGNKA
jgi:hypothetical protein